MDQLEMFGKNIYLLIGILLFAVLSFVLLVAVWTGTRILLSKLRQQQSDLETRRHKFHPDGRPIPPSAPGVCHRCGAVFPNVHHLPDGQRLCVTCYQSSLQP